MNAIYSRGHDRPDEPSDASPHPERAMCQECGHPHHERTCGKEYEDQTPCMCGWKRFAEKADSTRPREVRVDFQDSGWKDKCEQAERKCAELARLTTLRPASEHDKVTRVLSWHKHLSPCYPPLVTTILNSDGMWTPLPTPSEPKEADRARRGVIAALASVMSAQGDVKFHPLESYKLPKPLKVYLGETAWHVEYAGETIRIGYDEIMDALAGRVKSNHCPACGLDCGAAPKMPEAPVRYVFARGDISHVDPARQSGDTKDWQAYDRTVKSYYAAIAADKAQPHGVASECPRCHVLFGRQA